MSYELVCPWCNVEIVRETNAAPLECDCGWEEGDPSPAEISAAIAELRDELEEETR